MKISELVIRLNCILIEDGDLEMVNVKDIEMSKHYTRKNLESGSDTLIFDGVSFDVKQYKKC